MKEYLKYAYNTVVIKVKEFILILFHRNITKNGRSWALTSYDSRFDVIDKTLISLLWISLVKARSPKEITLSLTSSDIVLFKEKFGSKFWYTLVNLVEAEDTRSYKKIDSLRWCLANGKTAIMVDDDVHYTVIWYSQFDDVYREAEILAGRCHTFEDAKYSEWRKEVKGTRENLFTTGVGGLYFSLEALEKLFSVDHLFPEIIELFPTNDDFLFNYLIILQGIKKENVGFKSLYEWKGSGEIQLSRQNNDNNLNDIYSKVFNSKLLNH